MCDHLTVSFMTAAFLMLVRLIRIAVFVIVSTIEARCPWLRSVRKCWINHIRIGTVHTAKSRKICWFCWTVWTVTVWFTERVTWCTDWVTVGVMTYGNVTMRIWLMMWMWWLSMAVVMIIRLGFQINLVDNLIQRPCFVTEISVVMWTTFIPSVIIRICAFRWWRTVWRCWRTVIVGGIHSPHLIRDNSRRQNTKLQNTENQAK